MTAPTPEMTRRRCLGCATLLLGAAPLGLAGCGREEAAKPAAALEIDPRSTCSLDGMLLADYPGPKGQIHYADRQEVAWFCDTMELLSSLVKPEQLRPVRAAWVQDMARTDWAQPRGAWIDAKQAVYVLGSRKRGSMGATAASFAERPAAEAFAKEHGGRVLHFAELKPEMVDLSGGAHHDGRM